MKTLINVVVAILGVLITGFLVATTNPELLNWKSIVEGVDFTLKNIELFIK